MANKDVVFVAFGLREDRGMILLEWIFDHFEIEEISLVLTCFCDDPSLKTTFREHAENKYLPRCRKEKFEARILILEQKRDAILLELINKHGMTKLIIDSGWISGVVENYSMNFSIRAWGIDTKLKRLVFIRDDESVGEMDMMEYLPNRHTSQQHPLKKKTVFIALDGGVSSEEQVLDWVFQNFEKEKTKLVLTTLSTQGFLGTYSIMYARSEYLPRCQTKEFETKMLVPRAKNKEDIILELITEHGMERFIVSSSWLSYILEGLGAIPNNPCMIWIVHQNTGKLVHFRDARETRLLQKENDLHQQKIERRHLTKEYEDLLIKKPQSNKKLEEISQKLQAVNTRILDLRRVKNSFDLPQSQNNVSQEEKNEMLEELNQLKEDHDKLHEKLTDAIEENKRLQTENEEMKNKEQEANMQMKIIERNLADSEVARQNLEIELEDVRDMLQEEQNNASREIQDLKERLQSLQINYTKVQTERDNIVKEAERLHMERNRSDFTLEELDHATQNFNKSLILGQGGFGCVYRGHLRGTIVAVKILNSQCTEGITAFKREVDILTSVRHPNLVTLMGACYEASALVYEFLPNGSLEENLNHKNSTSLTWQVRTSIMAEICLALIFLHSSKPNMVIHGDLKPDNVLLDANFVSKLGDFGISRLIEQTGVTPFYEMYNAIGTPGYMDPEFVYTLQLTEKSDVFAFGVIVLRLITGKPVKGNITTVREAMKNETLHEIIDESAGMWPFDRAEELAMLGLRCVQINGSDRPNLFNDVWPIVERLRRH